MAAEEPQRRAEDVLAAQVTGILSAQIGRVEGAMNSGFTRMNDRFDRFENRLRDLEDWRITQETRDRTVSQANTLSLSRRQASWGLVAICVGLGGFTVGAADFLIRVLGGY